MDAAPKPQRVSTAPPATPGVVLTRAVRRGGRASVPSQGGDGRRAPRRSTSERWGPGAGQQATCRGGRTGVEEDDGAQAAQLRLVHLHVPHLGHELRQHPAEEAGHHHRPVRPRSPLAWAPPAGKTLRTGSPRPEAKPCGPRESGSPQDMAFLPPTQLPDGETFRFLLPDSRGQSKPWPLVRGQDSEPPPAGPAPVGRGVRLSAAPCGLSSPTSSAYSWAPKTRQPCPGRAKRPVNEGRWPREGVDGHPVEPGSPRRSAGSTGNRSLGAWRSESEGTGAPEGAPRPRSPVLFTQRARRGWLSLMLPAGV